MQNGRRSSLLWAAVAALTIATLARAESGIASGITSARAYASPFFQVLAACQASDDQQATLHSRSHSAGTVQNSAGQPLVTGLLPVLFVGLLLPLSIFPHRLTSYSRPSCIVPLAPVPLPASSAASPLAAAVHTACSASVARPLLIRGARQWTIHPG